MKDPNSFSDYLTNFIILSILKQNKELSESVKEIVSYLNDPGVNAPHVIETLLHGNCHMFAAAYFLLTNKPIVVWYEDRIIDGKPRVGMIHCFCQLEQNLFIDAKGKRTLDSIREDFKDSIVIGELTLRTEKQLKHFINNVSVEKFNSKLFKTTMECIKLFIEEFYL